MITGVAHLALLVGITCEACPCQCRQTANAWASNDDLVQKFYVLDLKQCLGGGAYTRKSTEAARRRQGDECKAQVHALFASEVRRDLYDTLTVVDNVSRQIHLPTEDGAALAIELAEKPMPSLRGHVAIRGGQPLSKFDGRGKNADAIWTLD